MAGANQSGIYIGDVRGDLRPQIMCIQITPRADLGPQLWNLALPSGHSDVEQLAGSCPAIPIVPSGYLNFGSGSNIHTGVWQSRTIPFLFMPRWDNRNKVTTDVAIFNMKLWIDNDNAFSGLQALGLSPHFQMLPSGEWITNLSLSSGQYGAFAVPTALPADPNVARIDGAPWLSGVGFERTQIIYSNIIFQSGTYPTGRFGGLGEGDFHWRFTYDWADENAHIHLGLGSGSYTDY